jgi:hypothetical protein
MKRCGDHVYLRHANKLFLYDSLWTTFRPVQRVVWNTQTRQVEPFFGELCADCLDPYYGFGSADVEDLCTDLTDKHIDNLDTAEELTADQFWKWCHEKMEWVRDRAIALHTCEDSLLAWRSYTTKHKTMRRAPTSFDWRSTKRKIR